MVYEYDKKHLRERYHGNKAAMRKAGDCVIWTQEHVQKCFAFGKGTQKDLREYMNNNARYCIFEGGSASTSPQHTATCHRPAHIT